MGKRRHSLFPRIAPKLYRWARKINTVEALISGDPGRLFRRVRNIYLGRFMFNRGLGLSSIWRRWLK